MFTRDEQRVEVLSRMSTLYTPEEASRMLKFLECSKQEASRKLRQVF